MNKPVFFLIICSLFMLAVFADCLQEASLDAFVEIKNETELRESRESLQAGEYNYQPCDVAVRLIAAQADSPVLCSFISDEGQILIPQTGYFNHLLIHSPPDTSRL